ncbi:MAG: 3-hydroxyacyl-CoA dehydrogenase family protein [Spirochaetaceae bacterium]|nr:3-hydroxyacyl-CoA dehydrogenase family protein [Myxococcales bacterium]MCB9722516.1 3-hydroxyacyl-CoA dehydrogenase family protein [Spirochaetaceae bacterium]HPG24177.1 3-hydroxyacyl-CoA dehydrogenase family protein [Myxococcota bacterium]
MRIAVIGAGVMGSGIAQVLAQTGHDVVCTDVDAAALDKARANVTTGRYGVDRAVERGKLSRADADATLARLRFGTDLAAAVADVALVIECVPERLDLKVKVFRELDRLAPADCVLASNSSGFPLAALAAATDRPSRVLVWHWASPPVVMKFAEIVVLPSTDEDAIARVRELAAACGKHPVVVKDQPMAWGYVANRIYAAMLVEAGRVVAEGVASHEEVNRLMVDCFGWPVGPFAMVKGAQTGFGDA